MLTAEQLISLLNLAPLPVEGGYFRQTYLSTDIVSPASLPPRYDETKAFSSLIYFLLHDENFSCMHRLPTDEVYHFYLGDPVEMLLLYPGGKSEIVILGSGIAAGQRVQFVAPRGVWQGSHLLAADRHGKFALGGTTMAPAYTDADFELGKREDLIREFPDRADLIRALTRE